MGGAPSPPGAREAAVSLAIAAAGVALVLFEALFGGRSTQAFRTSDPRVDIRPWARPAEGPLEPINLLTPDITGFLLPGRLRAERLLAEGASLDWDPAQLAGHAFAGNLSFPAYSPLARLGLLVDPLQSFDLLLFAHLTLAAWGAYLLARRLGVGRAAAWIAAVGFAGSAWMSTRWHLATIVWTAAFLPFVLHGVLSIARGRAAPGAWVLAAATGLSLVSGFPQAAFTSVLLALAVLFAVARTAGRRGVAAGLVGLAVGFALGAPQTVRSAAAFEVSLRNDPDVKAATARRGLPAGALLGALLPDAFGRPADYSLPDPPAPSFERHLLVRWLLGDPLQNNPVENALYPGVLVLVLLGLAIRGFSGPGAREARAAVWASVACVLLAVVLPGLVRLWPALSAIAAGNVKRVLLVPAFLLPLAAALAFQALLEGRARVPRLWLVALALLLALAPGFVVCLDDSDAARVARDLAGQALRQALFLGAAAGALLFAKRRPRGAAVAALVLFADLALYARSFNPFPAEEAAPYGRTEAIEAIAARPGRVCVFGDSANLLPAPAAAVHGIESVLGMVPLVPARTARLLGCIEGPLFDPRDPRVARPLRDPASLRHPVLDLLGVATVVHADPDLPRETGWPEVFRSERERIAALARPHPLPRAFLLTGAQVVPDRAERLARLSDPSFDPRAAALLESEPSVRLPEEGGFVAVERARHWVGGHEIVTRYDRPAVLVVQESFDPGWRVFVDGEEAPVLAVDEGLVGVAIDAGRHEVRWVYRTPGARAADAAALAALVLVGAALAAGLVRAGVRAMAGRTQ